MEDAAWQVVYEGPCPIVALGPHRFDLRHRAIVVGVVPGPADLVARALRLLDDRPDAIELGMGLEVGEAHELDELAAAVEVVSARCELPIAVRTVQSAVLRATLSAGAVVGCDPHGFTDPDYLSTAAAAGASVVAIASPDRGTPVDVVGRQLHALAERAEAAGIPPDQVLVDAGLDRAAGHPTALDLLRAHHRLAALGRPLVLSVSTGAPAADHAAHALGVALGARILRTTDVRGARRTADVLAAILEARALVPR